MSDQFDAQFKALVESFMNARVAQSLTEVSDAKPPVSAQATSLSAQVSSLAQQYIDFTYENPTIYHVVQSVADELKSAGFSYISEKDDWSQLKAGKYWTTRSGTSLAAFIVGKDWTPEQGVGIIGSHIDALTVLLKPNSTKEKVEGYELLGVAPYAGALSDVWWDRDLGIGGRLLVKSGKEIKPLLVDSSPHPIARIPTLAPHFGAPSKGPFNRETQAVPVIGFSASDDKDEPATDEEKSCPLYGSHPLKLLRYVAKLANIKVSDIVQWDMQLYDVQKGNFGGLNDEFIFAPRVDDRVCSFAAYKALISSVLHHKDDQFSVVALFDNEEIGSNTRQGARGGLIELVVSRVISSLELKTRTEESVRVAYANSMILSADVTHLLNPNFAGEYLEKHRPVPNKGLSIALDSNGHMATDGVGLAIVQQIARDHDLTLQYFQVRNDAPSGGTIGPFVSTLTGALTVDCGIPQLSMHSIRAALGSEDVKLASQYFTKFFGSWRETYDKFGDI